MGQLCKFQKFDSKAKRSPLSVRQPISLCYTVPGGTSLHYDQR
ncbi:hypothetical protein AVDCRST_MAG94-4055 [uncultured Leptolyngbya sp.]|uniref:Uncharacterized protein n=1 Tax=uncultured Leptolyngbya sp. TaxID=332963 RepID=A0A6J4MYE4_9CYAN|nr:hypothetical protein AVDCRST_MAG94-4055 [uncultured Leptolyngbya sp.]